MSTFSFAQTQDFVADVTRGCAPLTVHFHNLTTGKGSINYIFDNSGTEITDSVYTYNSPGIYTVTQVFYGTLGTLNGRFEYTKTNYIQILTTPDPQIDIAICEGGIVKVTTDNIYDKYIIDYKDGKIDTVGPGTTTSHTYTTYSPKTITIKGRYTPTWCGSADVNKTATLIQALKVPDISRVIVNSQSTNGNISLIFNASPEQRYVIQQSINSSSTGFISLDTLTQVSGIQTYAINNLNTQNDTYCFRILSIDDCNPPKVSDVICSTIVTVTAGNNQDIINWTPHLAGNEVDYTIIKDNSSGVLQTITPPTTNYNDPAVKCGVKNCYKIITEISGSLHTLQSISDNQCVTAISTNIPPSIPKLNSTILNGGTLLFWDKPTTSSVKIYNILRSPNGGSYSNIGNSKVNTYTDKSISVPDNSYCYQINYSDSCDKPSSLSSPTCPVILTVSIDPTNVFKNNLSWNSYTGSWIPDEYLIQRLDQNNNIITMVSAGTALTYQDITTNNSAQFIRYRILASRNGGVDVSFSNIVEIKYEGQVFAPTAFTPNSDGNNDVFYPEGRFIKEFKMSIFSRWGEVVYTTDQITEGWNGFYNGIPATSDAYAYLIEATDYWGKTITKRGSVTLLK